MSPGIHRIRYRAMALLLVGPLSTAHPSNECDVETIEVEGALASVFRVNDQHGRDATTTIIWAEEDER